MFCENNFHRPRAYSRLHTTPGMFYRLNFCSSRPICEHYVPQNQCCTVYAKLPLNLPAHSNERIVAIKRVGGEDLVVDDTLYNCVRKEVMQIRYTHRAVGNI